MIDCLPIKDVLNGFIRDESNNFGFSWMSGSPLNLEEKSNDAVAQLQLMVESGRDMVQYSCSKIAQTSKFSFFA